MKKIITTLFLFITFFSFGQCANLYVKKHYSGDPICQLYPGASLEICLENKTVRGGSCDFYIIAVRDNYDGMSIDLALDNVYWAPKYAELKINTKFKNFGFIIGNRSGAYSYYNEADMNSQREQERIEYEKMKLIDKTKHKEINDLFSKGKIIDAYSKMNELNAPQEYPNYSEVNNSYKKFVQNKKEIEDKKIKNDITKLLKSKNTILDAAKKYSTLNSGDVTLYKQINESIEKYYGDETIEISKEKLEEIISLNKDNLTSLSNGKHIIVMNKNGELTILNQNLKLNKFNQSESKNYSNFVIALKSQAEIQIKSDTSAIQDAVIRSQTFDGCKIHKNIFGQPFRYKFLKGSWIRAYYDLSQDGYAYQKSEKNEHLSKKDLVYVKKSNINKYANSLLINTSEIDIVQKQEKLHNRLPKVIWRSTILTFGAFWIGLRSYEFSKIN